MKSVLRFKSKYMTNTKNTAMALEIALKELKKHAKWEDEMIADEEDKCCKKALIKINSLSTL